MKRDKFANLVLISFLFYLGVILLNLIYKQIRGYDSSTVLYITLIVIALCVAIILRIPVRYKVNVSISIVSTLGILYFVEGFLVMFGSPVKYINQRSIAALKVGRLFDSRGPYEVMGDLRTKGENVYRFVPPADFIVNIPEINGEQLYALSSISDVTTLMSNESGTWEVYQSDQYGFNNPKFIWDTEILDIAVVGDSFAHGLGVSSQHSAVSLIRNVYPKLANVGYSGNGPLSELASIREYLSKYKPSVVLWFYYEGNDLSNLYDENNNILLKQYLLNENFQQELIEKQLGINQHRFEYLKAVEENILRHERNKFKDDLLAVPRLRQIRQLLTLVGGSDPKPRIHEGPVANNLDDLVVLFADVLQQASSEVDRWGGQLHFVYLPEFSRYAEPDERHPYGRNRVLSAVERLKIPIIDLHPVFNLHPNRLCLFTFCMDGHYNEEGYELIANKILNSLKVAI